MSSKPSIPKRSKSFKKILATARVLMNKHGVSRITVEELCSEAGVSKMTFYRNFENKQEVAAKLLEESMEQGLVAYRAIMKSTEPYPEKIRQMILLKKQGVHDIGEEFIKDIFHNENHELKAFLEEARKRNIEEYIKDFKDAQVEGWIRKDIKVELIITLLDNLYHMMENPALNQLYSSQEELIMELTNFYFYGIVAQPK